jgi:DNA primase
MDDREKVLDATDLVELVGSHLALRPKGREFVCLCPFHDDHNPSMNVVPHKQIFKCFVCGAGGTAIDFVMRYHAMEFIEALRFLADRAGIDLAPSRPRAGGAAAPDRADAGVPKADLAEANAFAAEFFRAMLRHQTHGSAGRALIERRGISQEMVERFGLGVAPDRWDGLVRMIETRQLDPRPFEAAGLIKRRAEGGLYDAFRNRLMFPIVDQLGRVVAFGGRVIDPEDEPKYLNSSENALFQKGSTMYGLREGMGDIRRSRRVVVSEGYTDVIACHQAGFGNVVATLGTALTERHAAMLRRVCDEVVLLFDGDEAGQRAADRAFEVFFRETIDLRVAVVPEGEDPDDLLKRDGGPGAFAGVLDGASDAMAHRFDRLRRELEDRGLGATSAGRARVVEAFMDRLAQLGLGEISALRRRQVVRRLASVAGVDEGTIAASLRQAGRRGARRGTDEQVASNDSHVRPTSPWEWALACLLSRPELAEDFSRDARDIVGERSYGSGSTRAIADRLAQIIDTDGQAPLARVLSGIEDGASRSVAAGFAAEAERITDGDAERLRLLFEDSVRRLARGRALAGDDGRATERPAEQNEPGAGGDALDRLLEVRDAHRRFGGDPTRAPRPAV